VTAAGRPARVLLVTAAGERGGAEVTIERIARHLDADRFSPVLAAPADSALLDGWRAAGFDAVGVPPVTRLRSIAQTRRTVAALASIAADRDVAIVHSHGMAAQLHAGLAARRARRAHIAHGQDMFDASVTRNGLLHRIALAVPRDVTIACSSAVARSLGRRGEAGRCEVIPNPVETDIVEPIAHAGPLVVWCGRLQRWKGVHLFLRMARQILDQHPAARFAVVGGSLFGMEPQYPAELKRLAVELGIDAVTEFVGQVADSRPWMRASVVLVHSSERPEPFGLVMAEAMVQERPVVAFDAGGASEIIVDGKTGRLVRSGDVDALARAVNDLLGNAEAAAAMGAAGRARAVERFAAGVVARQVEAAYDRVLANR
jgi:glycosyltransferase involved in cell wall biosynthesis